MAKKPNAPKTPELIEAESARTASVVQPEAQPLDTAADPPFKVYKLPSGNGCTDY